MAKAKKEFPFKTFETLTIAFFLFSLVSFFICIYIFYNKTTDTNLSFKIEPSIWGNLGSFLSGAIGSIFSITAIALLFMTYKAQKKELEATREVMIGQSKALNIQQFENTFFKLLDNHDKLLKNFEGNLPAKEELNRLASRLIDIAKKYNESLSSKIVRGVFMAQYDPFHDPIFEDELVGKIVDDINHIGSFVISKKYLNAADSLFYFMSLFNSLFNSEKYFYGYQSFLSIEELMNQTSAEINASYNDYFNKLPNESKISFTNADTFYPPISILIVDRIEFYVSFQKLFTLLPDLNIVNLSNQSVELLGIKLDDYEFKNDDPYVLIPQTNYPISLMRFMNQTYFNNEMQKILSTTDKLAATQIIVKLGARRVRDHKFSLTLKDSKNQVFCYECNFRFAFPGSVDQEMILTLT